MGELFKLFASRRFIYENSVNYFSQYISQPTVLETIKKQKITEVSLHTHDTNFNQVCPRETKQSQVFPHATLTRAKYVYAELTLAKHVYVLLSKAKYVKR